MNQITSITPVYLGTPFHRGIIMPLILKVDDLILLAGNTTTTTTTTTTNNNNNNNNNNKLISF